MLWNKPGIPHTGWTEMRVTDLDQAVHTCEMCGKEEIRYVHRVQHPQGIELDVGQVCAVKMTGDGDTADRNLKLAQNFAGARQRWFRKDWELSAVDQPAQYIWKSTRTITASAVRRANGLWHWDAEVGSHQSGGYARDQADAENRIEQYVRSLQY
jgi:hypothetical protein